MSDRWLPPPKSPLVKRDRWTLEPQPEAEFEIDAVALMRDIAKMPRVTPTERLSIFNRWHMQLEAKRMTAGNALIDTWIARLRQYNTMAETMIVAERNKNELAREREKGRYAVAQVEAEYKKYFAQMQLDLEAMKRQLELAGTQHDAELERLERTLEIEREAHRSNLENVALTQELKRETVDTEIQHSRNTRASETDKVRTEITRNQYALALEGEQVTTALDKARNEKELEKEKHLTLTEREKKQRELDKADFDAKIAEAKKKERRSKED